ncbi:MAG: hypothetical protein JXN65_11065 [Clostridia bacterium]|nr:hypothetical protein [Clostridia bacterium]
MKRKIIIYLLAIVQIVLLAACNSAEYDGLTEEIALLEEEYAKVQNENLRLKQEKNGLKIEIEELTAQNREYFEDTIKPYQYFNVNVDEYIEKVKFLNQNPEELWYNANNIFLLDELVFENEDIHFESIYTCEIFNIEDTGERCIAEITALDTGMLTKIQFTYYYAEDGEVSDLGYQHYFNYSDIFVSAFIMLNSGRDDTDDEFEYYFERLFKHALYYDGNAWGRNYVSADGKYIVFQILPIGLKD